MTTAAIVFAVVACVAIAAIGIRFLVVPTAATRDFGVRPDDARALTAIKGVRDITSGLVPMVVWAVAGVPRSAGRSSRRRSRRGRTWASSWPAAADARRRSASTA
jgi:hypothetical protein